MDRARFGSSSGQHSRTTRPRRRPCGVGLTAGKAGRFTYPGILNSCKEQKLELSPTYGLMKSYRKELWFEANQRRQFFRITPQIEQCVQESGVAEGLVLVNAMHITASVFVNDNESGLHHDFERWLEKLAPEKPHSQYEHNGAEDNADAHLKRTVMGREAVVAITKGKLDFGPWEEIFYGEFDGKRRKRVLIKIIGE
jgi:secondary thiamine-phosphate synthase enzyme